MPMDFLSFFLFFATKGHGYCSKRFCSRGSNNSVIEESVARHDILLAFCADPGRLIGNWYFNRTAIIVTWLRKTSQQLPGHESTKVSFRSICQWLSFVFFRCQKARVLFNDFVREAVVIASLRKVSRAMIFCLLFVLIPNCYMVIDVSIEPQ